MGVEEQTSSEVVAPQRLEKKTSGRRSAQFGCQRRIVGPAACLSNPNDQIPGDDGKLNLDCTKDDEKIFCQLEAKECSEYNLTLQDHYDSLEELCPLQPCNSEKCCCFWTFISFEDIFTAKVRRDGKELEEKNISPTESFKPKAPTIESVTESNGKLKVRWKTNTKKWLEKDLTAEITFTKKGDPKKPQVYKATSPTMENGLQYYAISSEDLDSDTTYMISVRSFSKLSGKLSDSSNEWEFTTSSSKALVWGLILGLSVFAVILSAFMFCCYVKSKRKWLDIYPELKLTVLHLSGPLFYKTEPIKISVCVPEEEMSKEQERINNDRRISKELTSPELLEALQKPSIRVFPSLKELVSVSLSPGTVDEQGSGLSDIFNHTYSLFLPNFSGEKKTEMLSVFECSSDTSNTVNDPDRQTCLFPAQDTSFVPTKMSYQPCKADRWIFSPSEGSTILSDTNRNIVDDEFEMFGEKALRLGFPFHDFQAVPFQVDYQPVPGETEQPDVLMTEKLNNDTRHLLNKCPGETFNKVPQPCFNPITAGFINNTQNPQGHPGLLPPFLPMPPADSTMKVISDYHGV
ncbi:uncharacterized protein il4r.2 isoform X4 [Kryptolebias marmoratus]|uniref:uncharacterized protein il4r.2 isoform X4 n=1 Tax=Kryptolebias marmoratus TaxID=37003 RepID=UPI0018AD0B3C|nr:uncharacterized protein il4r.2 isoform X4 [Kryptolebias marmoratus]